MNELIAHQKPNGEIQTLKSHLENTADLAASYANSFGGKEEAYLAGLLHDLGKSSPAGQKRMRDPEHTAKVDHSTAGAKEAFNKKQINSALCIMGHHSGLPNFGSKLSSEGDGTFCGRLKKPLHGVFDYHAGLPLVQLPANPSPPEWYYQIAEFVPHSGFSRQFYIRMLYSCLVDADFQDTEAFMSGISFSFPTESLATLNEKLDQKIKKLAANPMGKINIMRNRLMETCIHSSQLSPGLFTLTIPTGGGKTLDSLAFALKHALRYKKKRIIYVIPYTSIIDQNAAIFSSILGKENVIEHYSGAIDDAVETDAEDVTSSLAFMKRKLIENWDAPVIVTTAVQFFESLFSNRSSKNRKLHNIADSVLIFDEAQLIPLPYLEPCVAAITELVMHYGVSAIFCTATQPALNGLIHQYAPKLQIQEICSYQKERGDVFQRCVILNDGLIELSALAERISTFSQVLCIVNTKATARKLFEMLPHEGSYHLSTSMTPHHRKQTLEVIRERLCNQLPCRVISTCLIEAGVDISFPTVWRELTGLDSIFQAAGRCNREAKAKAEESKVHVFSIQGVRLPSQFRQPAQATEHIYNQYGTLDGPETIHAYFEFLLSVKSSQSLDEHQIISACERYDFKTVAESFKLIDSDTKTIIIPCEENRPLIQALREESINRNQFRILTEKAVNIYPYEYMALLDKNAIELTTSGIAVLRDLTAYDPQVGLLPSGEIEEQIWLL